MNVYLPDSLFVGSFVCVRCCACLFVCVCVRACLFLYLNVRVCAYVRVFCVCMWYPVYVFVLLFACVVACASV